eukprot:768335-Hanusia_phi.AAC.10
MTAEHIEELKSDLKVCVENVRRLKEEKGRLEGLREEVALLENEKQLLESDVRSISNCIISITRKAPEATRAGGGGGGGAAAAAAS